MFSTSEERWVGTEERDDMNYRASREEELQTSLSPNQEEEEELRASVPPSQEEEEELRASVPPNQEEEKLRTSVSPYQEEEEELTWPQLQQVMQGLDVPLEIHGVGKLLPQTVSLRCSPQPPSSSPGLLGGGEEDRPEAHCQVLVGHPVEGAEGGHQAEVVQQEGQRGLKGERANC